MSLEARKKEVEDAIASQAVPSREPARVKLTFRGRPVVEESYGIFAEFGAAAVKSFAEAVAAIGVSKSGPLGQRGAIPNRDDYRLLITGTTVGSFGFELEEAPKDIFHELSPVESAIEQAKAIMESSVGSDDELADAVSEIDPRALEVLRAFLKIMADQEAVCTLEFKDKIFRFTDVGQVRRSEKRLSQDNIHEEDREITGTFQGILPNRHIFEFLVKDTGEVISSKVGPAIDDAGQINHALEKLTRIYVHTTRVGTGRPRYVLLRYEESQDSG